MAEVIGACGYTATGSSAVTDLLKEFDETQVIDSLEFVLAYFPDGLEDLESHLKRYNKYSSSIVSIERFIRFVSNKHGFLFNATKGKIISLTNDFIDKIVQVEWFGSGAASILLYSKQQLLLRRVYAKLCSVFGFLMELPIYDKLFSHKMYLSIYPENFDGVSREYIGNILLAMGWDTSKTLVLDQPFEGCNPIKSFKYFASPKAIVVDRDPRDHYLFAKNFLRKKNAGRQIPYFDVDSYIKYFKLIRQEPTDIRARKDILHINFESLIYDYEESVKSIMEFSNISQHIKKKKIFDPSLSRNNTQLFKKYSGFENDISRIEQELSQYLFPFEKYPDIEAKGEMFFGRSPLNK